VEDVSVYDIKDHDYAKFGIGSVFVRVDSVQVCVLLAYNAVRCKY